MLFLSLIPNLFDIFLLHPFYPFVSSSRKCTLTNKHDNFIHNCCTLACYNMRKWIPIFNQMTKGICSIMFWYHSYYNHLYPFIFITVSHPIHFTINCYFKWFLINKLFAFLVEPLILVLVELLDFLVKKLTVFLVKHLILVFVEQFKDVKNHYLYFLEILKILKI